MFSQMLTMLAFGGSLAYAQMGASNELSQSSCDNLRDNDFKVLIDSELGNDIMHEESLNCWAQIVNGTNYWFEIELGVNEYTYVKIYKPLAGAASVTCSSKNVQQQSYLDAC